MFECDPSSVDGGDRVDAMCAVAARVAQQQALLLEAMAGVAATSVGIGFDADEIAFALHLPRMVAQRELALARDLLGRLPAVFAALSAGRICLARARTFSDVLTPVADDGLARKIADDFLPPAEGWTASQLRSRLIKAVLCADPDAAQARAARSIEERRLSLTANDDTTACLSGIYLPPVRAAAAFERVDAIARGLKGDGEARTLDQLRADVFCDLLAGISPAAGPVLRAGAVELLVPLSTLTGQTDDPGHLAGYGPVLADVARQVAAQSAAARSTAEDPIGVTATARAAGDVAAPAAPVQWRYRVHDTDGRLLFQGTTRARPQRDNKEPGSVATDTANDASGPHRALRCHSANASSPVSHVPVEPCPPEQPDPAARFPSARLRAWIAARDTTCRAPGCTAPARSCDVDHTIGHSEGGATVHDNLGLACRHHHRTKHDGGFTLEQAEPGCFRWTSPTGHTYDVVPDPP